MINNVILGGRVITVKGKKQSSYVYLSDKYKFMDKYTKEIIFRECRHWIRFDDEMAKIAYDKIKTNDFIIVDGKLTYVKESDGHKKGLILARRFCFVSNLPVSEKRGWVDETEIL